MGHVVEHDLVRVGAVEMLVLDGGEFLLEEFAGHRTGILEITQTLVGEDGQVTIGYDGFEKPLPAVRFGMLLASKPAEEIGGFVVEQVGNEMMTDTDIGFAFAVDEGRSFAVESHSHRYVARQIACVQVGCGMIVTMSLVRFGETIRGPLSVGLEEIAIRMSPSDNVLTVLRRHLFATVA